MDISHVSLVEKLETFPIYCVPAGNETLIAPEETKVRRRKLSKLPDGYVRLSHATPVSLYSVLSARVRLAFAPVVTTAGTFFFAERSALT